jgi:hypothetical protein
MNQTIAIHLDITQVPQITNLLNVKTKIIFDIGCDGFRPNVAIILSIHALHLQRRQIIRRQGRHFEQNVTIECHGQKKDN